MGSKKQAGKPAHLKSVPIDIDEEETFEDVDEVQAFDEDDVGTEEDHGEEPFDEGDPDSFTNEMEDEPAPVKPKAKKEKTKPAPAKKAPAKAPAKKSSKAQAVPFDGKYEYELDGEVIVFTKRRALAFKAYLDTDGEADPKIVAADMEKAFGAPKKGTHLASARRIRGTYLKLKEAGVLK